MHNITHKQICAPINWPLLGTYIWFTPGIWWRVSCSTKTHKENPVKVKDTKVVKKQNNEKIKKISDDNDTQLISKVKATSKKSIPVTLKRKVWNKYICE